MTQPLSINSPRRQAAAKFGAELRRAMLKREVSQKVLARATGCAVSAVAMWKAGGNLPRLDTVVRLVDALDWPALMAIAREARSGHCQRCGREFINEGGSPKRYCSPECQNVDAQLRQPPPGRLLADAVRAELGRDGIVRRRPLATALAGYSRSDSKRQARIDRSARQLEVVQASVDAMCAGCEPLGVCRTPECALRPVSPLPLALRPDLTADEPIRPEGPWGPANRERMTAAIAAASQRRWARDGEREAQSARMRARHAAATPEEHAAWVGRISATKQARKKTA
ncbi:MAG: helix-turn-helix domain-containing protein [Candidatus Limnocylindrales bacterium]